VAIIVSCSCGKRLRVKDELAGKRIKCVGCGKTLAVPAPAEAEPEAPEPEGKEPFFWADLHALGGKIFALSPEAFYLADLKEKQFQRAKAALAKGSPVEEVLDGAEIVIPYDRIRKVESNLQLSFLDFTWEEKPDADPTETNVLCPDKDSRDEILAGLRGRLGPGWDRKVVYYSRLRASWPPLVVIGFFGFITFCFVMAARDPGQGDGQSKTVRTNWLGAIFVWVLNLFGPVGAGLLGGLFILAGVAWLVARMVKPPVVLTLTPHVRKRR
jgi:hypothetical protein